MRLDLLDGKKYFAIGEASRITGVPPHSIRYWEAEFQLLRPIRKASGRRLYTRDELEKLLAIKDLIYRQKMTLEGAKKYLHGRKSAASAEQAARTATDAQTIKLLREIHKELCGIIKEC